MSTTKEELLTLVQQAIPNPDAGVVNFRVLRDVLAATIQRHPGASTQKIHTRTLKSSAVGSLKLIGVINPPSVINDNEMEDLAERLNSLVIKFENLYRKLDKLNERVTNLENLTK